VKRIFKEAIFEAGRDRKIFGSDEKLSKIEIPRFARADFIEQNK
jgi:hypothetical protein